MADNKVHFGISNVHYSIITEGEAGAVTYATPVKLPGAVSLELSISGETSAFYADNINYYSTVANQGYEGTLTLADLPPSFREDVLGETIGTDGVQTETNTTNPKRIALLFEFDGDQKATRHCLVNCTVTRPGLSATTKTETAEPGTDELQFTAAPRADGVVKYSTTSETTTEVYNAWYTSVYKPTV